MLKSYSTAVESMVKSVQTFPWEQKRAYAAFLAQTYYYVCHSTRLLAASAARFSQQDQALHRRFLKHTQEESSHELLALRDLQKLGYELEEFEELPETLNLYETQYFKIEYRDPAALMGYIVALETMAGEAFPSLKARIVDLWGPDVVSFIKVHAEDDPEHIEQALKVIRSLSDLRLPRIDLNIRQTALNYTQMLDACARFKA